MVVALLRDWILSAIIVLAFSFLYTPHAINRSYLALHNGVWPRTPQLWRCAKNFVFLLFRLFVQRVCDHTDGGPEHVETVAVQQSRNTIAHVSFALCRTFVSHHDNHAPKCVLHVCDVIERAVSAKSKDARSRNASPGRSRQPVKLRTTPDLHRHMQAATSTAMSSASAIPTGFPSRNGSSEEMRIT
jgi:hypothetical protein